MYSFWSYASLKFVWAGRGHVLLQQYLQYACCSKTTFPPPPKKKCKITIIMCSDKVFTIIVRDLIRKLKKLQLLSLIYRTKIKVSKVVTFVKLGCYPLPPPPSTQSLNCSNKKSKIMHVLSLFRSAVLTSDFMPQDRMIGGIITYLVSCRRSIEIWRVCKIYGRRGGAELWT